MAWSTIAEPGDAVAGELVSALGAERALGLVLQAVDDGATRGGLGGEARGATRGAAGGAAGGEPGALAVLARDCAEAGVPGTEDLRAFAPVLRAALDRWVPRLGRADVGEVVAAARAVGARLLVPGGPTWPERVDDLGAHAPLVLWSRSAATETLPALAVVGSRANTVAGAEAAAEITSIAADAGCAIVSGAAYGIDAVAHRVAIAAGAPTVAVLAGGIDQLYPAGNVELLRNVQRQGALLAESPPGTRPTRWRFLARNRLIAALSDATVVVEAGARSGALNTAHHAGQLGRAVFAVPGAFSSSASVGCHRLVVQGRAQLVVHPRDPSDAVLASGFRIGPGAVDEPLVGARHDPEVLRVLDALGRRAMSEHEVAGRSGMSLAETADALALAQLQGLVAHTSGGWVRA
ncbi:DNA-processing protein DprA [Curtobacterium sp. MCPF17_002]|uniref:DNA-processing protein DprA n=1 Tax=Curtobacterium sp. MCPF17_002 TaxID=2175645 RepID=UPI0024DF5B3D|nr:DNA-processing protein DprA [Curtobacterium sp. MCPF17_002]WIB76216.1 DNA-processing protein DprA [Curtobacterium sp. MCPF17_002]